MLVEKAMFQMGKMYLLRSPAPTCQPGPGDAENIASPRTKQPALAKSNPRFTKITAAAAATTTTTGTTNIISTTTTTANKKNHNKQQTTHNTQHTTNHTEHTTNNKQRTTNKEQHTTHNTQHTTHDKQQTTSKNNNPHSLAKHVSCAGRGVSFGRGSPRGQRSMSKRNAVSLRQANMSCIRAAALLRSCCSFSAASCQCGEETQSTWTRPALLPFSASCFIVLRSALFFLFSCSFLVLLACQQNFEEGVELHGLAFKAFAALASSAASFFAAAFAARLAAARRFCLSFAVSSSWADARWDGLGKFFCTCGG